MADNKRAVYPGTFDPITYGHIDLIKRGLKLFDEIVIAVSPNEKKSPNFTLEERVAMVEEALKGHTGVIVKPFEGMAVDFVRSQGCNTLLRGLRTYSDFEFEFQMALTNRTLSEEQIETVFIMAGETLAGVSSRLIREIADLGGDLHHFVPDFVEAQLREKFGK